MSYIVSTEKYVRELHPDWTYKRIKQVAFRMRVERIAMKAKKLGIKLGG